MPYTGSGVPACIRTMDKVLTKHLLVERRAFRRRTSSPSTRRPSGSSAPRRHCPRSSSGSAFRSSSSRLRRARRSGSSSRARPDDVPEALIAAFSYDDKVLLERYVEGRELAVSLLEGDDGVERAAGRGGAPEGGVLLRLRGTLRDRQDRLRLPGEAAGRR